MWLKDLIWQKISKKHNILLTRVFENHNQKNVKDPDLIRVNLKYPTFKIYRAVKRDTFWFTLQKWDIFWFALQEKKITMSNDSLWIMNQYNCIQSQKNPES